MSTRKQYSSCDQCRRSKRKCTAILDVERNPCLNCSTRGRTCTFEFAKSHPRQRHRRHRTPISSAQDDQQMSANGAFDMIGAFDEEPFAQGLSAETGNGWVGGFNLDEFNVFEFSNTNSFDHDSFSLTDTLANVDPDPRPTWTSDYQHPPSTFPDLRIRQQCQVWNGTPMRLLNSSYTRMLMDDCLEEIYESVIFGLESRCLSHTCNVLRPKSRYDFVNEKCRKNYISETASAATFKPSNSCTPSHEPTAQVVTVTFVGLARFLDHFGALYGNRLGTHSKSEDEQLFAAAQRAFALQWFACENAGVNISTASSDRAHIFGDAWHNAERLILNNSSHVSFLRLYALLLFHTTGTPLDVQHAENGKNEFLTQIARELSVLKELVGQFYENLPPTSRYKTLLDTAVKVFEWFTYIKDTTASLFHDRKPILRDVEHNIVDKTVYDLHSSYPTLARESVQKLFSSNSETIDEAISAWDEAEISAMCQKATVRTFQLFRQILHLKESLRSHFTPNSGDGLLRWFRCAFELVDGFYLSFADLNSYCSLQFTNLSDSSKLLYCFMVFFWVCGVLSLVEQIRCANERGVVNETSETCSKLIEYEETAVASGITICQAFVAASASGKVNLSKNPMTNLPYIAHHVNLSLVVEVLQKLIEHAIEHDILKAQASEGPNLDQLSRVKPLLCCLSDLEATLASASMARRVREKLMQSYGDILLECWTVDYPELLPP